MTDDDIFFADICRRLGRTPPLFHETASAGPKILTAGVISKPKLVLVTLKFQVSGQAKLDETRSGTFDLEDRSSQAVRNLARELTAFCGRRGIGEVNLRSKSANNAYAGHALNFKIEAALQLVDRLRVTFVNTNSVGSWVRRTEPVLPEGGRCDLGSQWAAKRAMAVETALFTAAHYGERRFFWDGSADDE